MVTSTTVTLVWHVTLTEKKIDKTRVTKMRHLLLTLLLACGILSVGAQVATDTLGGEVTYRTSQNIYVKFQSTKQISIGDTLFLAKNGVIIPALIVNNLSSTSCVGTPLTDQPIEAGTRMRGSGRHQRHYPLIQWLSAHHSLHRLKRL